MKNIKMIVGDLDGTLLDNNKQTSLEMKRIRVKLKEQGILFVIATARSIASAYQYILELEPDYVISCDGGLVSKKNINLFCNALTFSQFNSIFNTIKSSNKVGRISIVSINKDYNNYGGELFPKKLIQE